MYSCALSLLALAMLMPARLHASDYSFEKKKAIYASAELPRQTGALVFSTEDSEWHDLDGDEVVEKLNQLANGERATILAASAVEFKYYCQPLTNSQTREGRRAVLTELKNHEKLFNDLNHIIKELKDQEYVFCHLMEQEQPKSVMEKQLFSFLFEGAFVSVATVCALPYAWKHFVYDWHSYKAKQVNATLLICVVALKVVGTLSTLYNNCMLIKNSAKQFCERMKKADSFVLDFARAMKLVEKLIELIKAHPTLANIYTNINNFPHVRKLNKRLDDALVCAESRLNSEGSIMALWKAKNSNSLYEEIKKLREYFIVLYYAIARLDCILAGERIRRDWEEHDLSACLAEFSHEEKPSFCFSELRNICVPQCVPNDFELDSNVVISGPSTCGKSAAMRTILWAHVFGLAMLPIPAKSARFAPIDAIATYFNVGDSIAKGQSSFKAQQLAISRICDLSNEKEKKILVAIDEPYKGITSDMGEKLVSNLVRDLAAKPHVMFLVSTHCKEATDIADEEDSKVKNWQVRIEKHDEDFIRTFKIEPGKALWWFIDTDEVEAFIKQIVRESSEEQS